MKANEAPKSGIKLIDEERQRQIPTMPSYEEWRNQMMGGLRPSDWDKSIVR